MGEVIRSLRFILNTKRNSKEEFEDLKSKWLSIPPVISQDMSENIESLICLAHRVSSFQKNHISNISDKDKVCETRYVDELYKIRFALIECLKELILELNIQIPGANDLKKALYLSIFIKEKHTKEVLADLINQQGRNKFVFVSQLGDLMDCFSEDEYWPSLSGKTSAHTFVYDFCKKENIKNDLYRLIGSSIDSDKNESDINWASLQRVLLEFFELPIFKGSQNIDRQNVLRLIEILKNNTTKKKVPDEIILFLKIAWNRKLFLFLLHTISTKHKIIPIGKHQSFRRLIKNRIPNVGLGEETLKTYVSDMESRSPRRNLNRHQNQLLLNIPNICDLLFPKKEKDRIENLEIKTFLGILLKQRR